MLWGYKIGWFLPGLQLPSEWLQQGVFVVLITEAGLAWSCCINCWCILETFGDLRGPNCMNGRQVILRMLASTSTNLESMECRKSMEIFCSSEDMLDPLRKRRKLCWGRELEASGEGEIREKLRAKGRKDQEERYSTLRSGNFRTILIDFGFRMLWEHRRHFGLPDPPAVIGQLVCCSHLSLPPWLLDPFITQYERAENMNRFYVDFMRRCTVPTHAP